MLNAEIKKTWIEALRSGNFKQGQRCLKQEVEGEFRYCCMGVLCEINGFISKVSSIRHLNDSKIYGFTINPNSDCVFVGLPPFSWCVKIGLSDNDTVNLARMNDTEKKSFIEIADYIEQNL